MPRKRKTPKFDVGYPLEVIEWMDHAGRSSTQGWADLSRMREDGGGYLCVSVGFVVAETKQHLTLCPHVIPESDNGTGEMHIVKSAIKRRHRIGG